MKTSQKALLSMAGVLAGIVVVTAVTGRVALSRSHVAVAEGDAVSGVLDLDGFREVEVAGAWRVTLTRGDEWRIELPPAGEAAGRIRAYVLGERLRLGRTTFVREGWRFAFGEEDGSPRRVDIVMPELAGLELKGGSRVSLSGFRGDRLDIDVAGAVRLEGRDGRYGTLALHAAGASDIDLRGIAVTDAEVDLKGASSVVLTMDGGVLSGSAAGAGSLHYYGPVSEERVEVAGVTRIVHRRE